MAIHKKRIKSLIFFLAVAVLVTAVAAGCSGSGDKAVSKSDRASSITVGKQAPDFTLKDQDGNNVALKDLLAESPVLIAFYPKDNSPVCTVEMTEFRDMYDEYQALGVQIIGISTNSLKSHMEFKRKNELPFPLLSDQSTEVSKAYDVFHEKQGVSRRSYFLVDKNGEILYQFVEQEQKQKSDKDELIAAVKRALKKGA